MEHLLDASDPDVQDVKATYRAALRRFPPQIAEAGDRLLEQIATPNWTLEWYLPRWLGAAYGIPESQSRTLILTNVYGLASVRLMDDLIDNQISRESSGMLSSSLGTVLNQLWVREYGQFFATESPFWGRFDAYVSQWLHATLSSNEPSGVGAALLTEQSALWLGHRGAPLKVCCAAVCELARRQDQLAILESAMDRLLAGAVLLDHIKDWEEDLAAGRNNVFVGYTSPIPQTPENRIANRNRVLEALYLDDAAQVYLDAVRMYLRSADEMIRAIQCDGLHYHLHWLDDQVATYSARLVEETRARLQAVTERFINLSAGPLLAATPQE